MREKQSPHTRHLAAVTAFSGVIFEVGFTGVLQLKEGQTLRIFARQLIRLHGISQDAWGRLASVYFEPKVLYLSYNRNIYQYGDTAITNDVLPPFHKAVKGEERPEIIPPLAAVVRGICTNASSVPPVTGK